VNDVVYRCPHCWKVVFPRPSKYAQRCPHCYGMYKVADDETTKAGEDE